MWRCCENFSPLKRAFRRLDWQSPNGISQTSVSQTIAIRWRWRELDEERRIGFGVSYGRYCCHGSCRAAPSPCSHLGAPAANSYSSDGLQTTCSCDSGCQGFLISCSSQHHRRLGVSRPPLVHYVAPSSWAWKGGENKLKNLADTLDHLLCILPFEAALFKAHGIKATYVGHPVLEDAFTSVATGENPAHCRWWIKGSKSCSRQDFGLQSGSTVVCVLPGSRAQEVKRMLPLFESALDLLADKVPMLTAIIPTAPSHVITDAVTEAVKSWKTPNILLPYASEKDKYSAFAASDVSLCTSGTAVLQLQMARVPTVVAYRAHPLTEWLIKSRTKLHYISLPNILLDSPVIPEALFADCTPQRLFTLLWYTTCLFSHVHGLDQTSFEQSSIGRQ
ncbi:hypothetical protein CY35_07G011200 [Sphagnum magellanicum]|uniref:Uncharacterized protein n=1 Tax=Sphagnum magellanicum TaxID=128215 RepID=A0ACB8HIY6_9BRYO|nr:hypothetical protein CY35_07G011200 [Sphagnum magellanicum]